MPRTKRKDKSRVVLRTGESQRADGTYDTQRSMTFMSFGRI